MDTDAAPPVDEQVVIVGCGPVGAGLAIALCDHGFRVTVAERHRTMYHLPRAIMLAEDVRRSFRHHGLEPHIDPMVTPMYGAEFVDKDRTHLLGFELPEGSLGALGLPNSSMFHQPDLDFMLRTVAKERGADLRLGATVTGIDQRDGEVAVTLDDGSTLTAGWVVGCDGAQSSVRSLVGIGTEDLGFDQDWLVVDIDGWRGAEKKLARVAQQICDPARPATFVPGHAHHLRWEFQLQPGEKAEELERPERVWELVKPWLDPADGSLIRAVVYRFHAMVADRMREGRVFLAGDAAHQMPPFLGQGLNSGFRDVLNLAWKLRLVVDGLAGDALLDTYDAERLPHARGVVEHAADVGRLIDSLAGRVDHEVDESSGYGGGRPFPFLESGAVVGESALVGRPLRQVRPGGAFTDDLLDPGFNVVADGAIDAVPAPLAGVVDRVVTVPEDLLGGHAALIVRPDHIVAAAADDAASLETVASQLAAVAALI
ncbi:MAG: bifunctional 3-(3-hydroxy-phenyl)propionate/3-hydroxycinnamic acid hydroxylase [Actinomycetota bacterium]